MGQSNEGGWCKSRGGWCSKKEQFFPNNSKGKLNEMFPVMMGDSATDGNSEVYASPVGTKKDNGDHGESETEEDIEATNPTSPMNNNLPNSIPIKIHTSKKNITTEEEVTIESEKRRSHSSIISGFPSPTSSPESAKSGGKAVKDFVINLFQGTMSSSEVKIDSIKGKKKGHTYKLKNISLTNCKFEEYTLRQNQKIRKVTLYLVGVSMKCCCTFSIVGPLFLKRQSINIQILLENIDLSASLDLKKHEIALDTCKVHMKTVNVAYDESKNERGGLKFLKKKIKIRAMKILKEVIGIDEIVRKKLVSVIENHIGRRMVDLINKYLYTSNRKEEENELIEPEKVSEEETEEEGEEDGDGDVDDNNDDDDLNSERKAKV